MTIEEHYRELAPKLMNWLVATGSGYAHACDLVQETFLRLWRMRDSLRDDGVSGLVFTIARNLRKNEIRDSMRTVLSDEVPETPDNAAAAPETMTCDAEYLRVRLKEAFAALPPLLREAYTLFQIAELSIAEIARTTNASESLVKVRIHRAKNKLREILCDLAV